MIMALLIGAFMPSFLIENGPVIGISEDNGESWNLLNGGEQVFTTESGVARDFGVLPALDGWCYLAYTAGNYGGDGYFTIRRSKDYMTWTHVADIDDPSGTPVDSGRSWGPKLVQDTNGDIYAFVACGTNSIVQPLDLRIYRTKFNNPNNLAAGWSDFVAVTVPDMNAVLNEVYIFPVSGGWRMQVLNFTANCYQTYGATSLSGDWSMVEDDMGFAAREGIFSLRQDDGTYRVFTANNNDAIKRYQYQVFASSFAPNGNPLVPTVVSPLLQIENGEPFLATGNFYLAMFPYSNGGTYSPTTIYS